MAFVDEVTIHAAAGSGGHGVVRWLHLRGKEKGGPSGGDGGRGGDVILEGVRDLAALARYRFEKDFRAENGGAGEKDLKRGKNGEPLLLAVPVGTVARILATGIEHEILEEGARMVLFRGGTGGKGNARFKSATNQNPFESTQGRAGEAGDIHLSLKLIADAGLVGLPSAGKSSLLNALTRAQAKVGDYPFTTLEPNLGDFYGYIIADIPGLIEGAARGKGLGTRFLKHIERTKLLLHLVSADQDDPLSAYREVRRELDSFGEGLAQKPEILILSKVDLVSADDRGKLAQTLAKATGREVLFASTEDPTILTELARGLSRKLSGKA